MAVQRRGLTVVDRTIIELRRRDGWSIRLIARELGRSSGTICDEIGRHGDAAGYLAATAGADAAASRENRPSLSSPLMEITSNLGGMRHDPQHDPGCCIDSLRRRGTKSRN